MTVLAAGALAAPVAFARPMPPSATDGAGRITQATSRSNTRSCESENLQPTDGVERLAKLRAGGWDAEPAKPGRTSQTC